LKLFTLGKNVVLRLEVRTLTCYVGIAYMSHPRTNKLFNPIFE